MEKMSASLHLIRVVCGLSYRAMSKLGLVFSGGGGKGAYQIGVWKALEEIGLAEKVKAVAGTSVGALNALLFAQKNFSLAEHLWLHIRQEDILRIDTELISKILREAPVAVPPALFEKCINFFRSRGLWSREGLIRMIQTSLDAGVITASATKLYAACTDVTDIPSITRPIMILTHYLLDRTIPEGTARYFRLNDCSVGQMQTILLASSAIPILFHAEKIDGRVYYDGGLMDNVPILPVYNEGCDVILVVQLDATTVLEREQFQDAEIISILPQNEQGGFISGTLDFSREGAEKRIGQGYADAMRILQPVAAMRDIQHQVGERLETIRRHEQDFQQKRRAALDERQHLKDDLDQYLK